MIEYQILEEMLYYTLSYAAWGNWLLASLFIINFIHLFSRSVITRR